MPKAKKSESEKAAKVKDLKPLKAEKLAKEKKGKKKDKAAEAPVAEIKPEKIAVAAKPKKIASPEPTLTTEEISLRAYFIAERRQAMGWAGDSAQDWVEAEKQLKAEALKKARLK